MASASSSSGLVPNALRKYDVFISFRGEDTRNNFTSHLYAALNRASLKVFRDDKQLEKGDEIAPSLIQAIKDSSVSIVVFSEGYASSKWCLDELAHIMQYRKDEGQYVVPIFYKVDPSHVRKQTGAYEKAFKEHVSKHDHDKVTRWKVALSEAGYLSGSHCDTSKDESNLIEEIVADILTKLERLDNWQGTSMNVVGIDEMLKPIEELLKKFHKIGIWGMGGVGKTTMATVVFTKLSHSHQYDNCCFLENIREETEKNESHVRDSLLSQLLGQDMSVKGEKKEKNDSLIQRRLRSKKALVVLDDVHTSKQLEDLQVNICDFLQKGSKVIVTTRNKGLLGKGYEIHEAKGLSCENSRRLFIHKAFGSNNPKDGYEELIEGFVAYTKHNPLALKVLGSYVHSQDESFWKGLLRKLKAGNPNGEILKVLRPSYDTLDYKEKQIFLDIACFLKGETKKFVEELLESYEFYPSVGLKTLTDRALIVMDDGKVEMHDLLQEMAYEIVREESINKPGKRSRLWDHNEVSEVLKNCEGEKEVEGIIMSNRSVIKGSDLTAKSFNKMTKLRFLKIYSSLFGYESIPGLESISRKTRYFHWDHYPWDSLPSNFCAELLVELNLSWSNVETLWGGMQDLAKLRRVNLKNCLKLKKLPDFSMARRLESVNLSGCESLCYVHTSLLSLHSLISLDVSFCINLESLQSGIHLKSLKQVNLFECSNLTKFSMSSQELTCLDLSEMKIEELSPSIVHCSNLRTLNLLNTELKHLPIHVLTCLTFLEELHVSLQKIDNDDLCRLLDCLRRLQLLSLWKCRNLIELPDNITQLSSLEELYLEEWPNLTKLPVNMRNLSKLQHLSVKSCTALHSLPELPPSLRKLNATNCTSLETVSPSTISITPQNYGEKFFSFINCEKLDLGAIEEQVKLLLEKAVHEKEDVAVYYPGSRVPEWFGNNRTQNDLHTLKLPLSCENLVGFVFWVVIADDFLDISNSFLETKNCTGGIEMTFFVEKDEEYEWDEENFEVVEFPIFTDLSTGNVLLRSCPEVSESILKKIEGNRGIHEAIAYETVFSCVFYDIVDEFCWKTACGVYPIHASECSELCTQSKGQEDIEVFESSSKRIKTSSECLGLCAQSKGQ